MLNFITNDETGDLKQRLTQLIAKSEELKFLVGFFYFSGIRELYESLQANPNVKLRVLVGLDVDRHNFDLVEYSEDPQLSDDEKTHKFFESIKKSINTEKFDTEEFYWQVKFFIELIRDERLLIRKTFEPNHAKLYIFRLEEGQVSPGRFITGSSNLTRAGLSTQNEFNVEIGDYGFADAEKYFDDLWGNAVKITEHSETKSKLIEIIQQWTLVKEVTPFEAFCLVMKTYLESFEEKEVKESVVQIMEKNGYTPYRYQLDAVRQGLSVLEKHNGVIVADVVGLGKTIVACAIAKQLNKRGVVICPPGLMGDKNGKSGWKRYLMQFGLNDWEVRSLGDLTSTLEFVNKSNDIEVVIVDEAHRLRNQDTRDYDLLKNICRERQVILLTATPFNNKPSDILALLSLFIVPKKSSITLDSNLVNQFRAFKGLFDRLGYIKKYWNSISPDKTKKAKKYFASMFGSERVDLKQVARKSHALAKQIRGVIEPVIIRRNRLDLQENPLYKDEVKELSRVANPQEWFFELNKEQSKFYSEIVESYFGDPESGGRFKGVIYRPFWYEKGYKDLGLLESEEGLSEDDNRQYNQQRNLFDFMRRLLVKRFESSFGSFKQSIENFKAVTRKSKAFIERTGEYILDRDLLEKIYELDEEEIEKYLSEYEEKINRGEYPKNHRRYKLSNFKMADEFLAGLDSDLALYDELLEKLKNLELVNKDPKTECLIRNIQDEFSKEPRTGEPKRKIIVFSEYVDTVLYLQKSLEKEFGKRILVVPGELSVGKIQQINENFDASYEIQVDEFDLLLTSDKISEGFNLNRAGMVINYDIPWNPVRVIQRLGRINRISKKVFNELYIINFFPTEIGAKLVASREIAANKMFLIHSALGEDSKIFDIDEEPTAAGLYQRFQQNPELAESESIYTKVLKKYLEIRKIHAELIDKLKRFPPRIKVAKKFTKDELLVFYKKNRLFVVASETGSEQFEPTYLSFEEAFEKIECGQDEPGLKWNTERFWQAYQALQNFKDYRVGPVSEQTLEMRALNKLDFLIQSVKNGLGEHKSFLRTLKEDILNFGSLSEFSLRQISNFEETSFQSIVDLKTDLKEDYLEKIKTRNIEQEKEIIIAIENKTK